MKTRGKALRTSAAVLVVIALLAGGVTAWHDRQNADKATVVALFTDASPLTTGSVVSAHGVQVGSVSAVSLDHGDARVTMTLDKSVLPLHTDAQATIRPVSLLGESYVSLNPGSASAPLMPAPAVIPVRQTSSSVTLQQILNTLNDPTSTALAALISTLGEGMQGNGANVASALRALAPAMTDTSALASVLDQQNALLNQLIDDATPVADSVADNRGRSLDQLVGSAQQALATVSANRQAVSTALTLLPATLSKAERTLTALTGAAQATTPTLQSVRPVTDNLTDISAELHQFADAANPALASLGPVLDRASTLLNQALPVVSTLKAGTPNLYTASGQLTRLGLTVVNNLGDLISFATGWAMCTSGYDTISHYFRGVADIDVNTLKELVPNLVPGLSALGGTPAPPTSGGATSGGAAGGTGASSSTTAPVAGQPSSSPPGPDNATGLSQQQEQSLFNQLLGGL
jgi:phospholipid/cholesterol/gamma-HCH transport system substrate-binding protein